MSRIKQVSLLAVFAACLFSGTVRADERRFAYSYEPIAGRKGEVEFEQGLAGKFGKESGNFAEWNFKEELEWGLTGKLDTSLILNFEDVYDSGGDGDDEDSGFDFTGISSEWKYQFVNPFKHPVGVMGLLELTTDGAHECELEEKLILGAYRKAWAAALNLTTEQEWEDEDGDTVEESEFDITAGISRKLDESWSVGLEVLHARGYIGGVGFDEEEYNATFAGPNLSYAGETWWGSFTVMPQIYGEGDGADDSLQLEHRERMEVRLLAGVHL